MSPLLPLGALVSVAFALIVLDFVQRDRSPPPWSVTAIRLLFLLLPERLALRTAMKLPPAGLLDTPTSPQPRDGVRVAVISGAMVLVAAAILTVAYNGLTS
ncbi:hypothetical protein [Brevundimonas sp.]|uniref:hypothetical protein n=1 Tax=Brevundimonas sp. TaxID=1871086 RepID=UPI0025B9487E|nr:hypothetical protein [Brevundimonas sp.]